MLRLSDLPKSLLKKLPGKYILFESVPDVADNTKVVFEEMRRRGLNKRHPFVWVCYEPLCDYPKYPNVYYLFLHDSGMKAQLLKYFFYRAKLVICCNSFMFAPNPKVPVFYLSHGSVLKDTSEYYKPNGSLHSMLSASTYFREILMKLYHLNKDQIVPLGFPRNDVLSLAPLDLHMFFTERDFDKVIVWYPTFRKHKGGRLTGSRHALPIIWDEYKAKELNTYAKENHVLLVLKPHFAQDVSVIKRLNFSNLMFIDDSFFDNNMISSYRFVGSCDALLTDYSTIYYDYTLCDKPIGLIWEDYEDYKSDPGFLVNMDEMMKGGEKIYTLEDLKNFIWSVANGEDRLQCERRRIRDICNVSTDGKNTDRVVDYLVKEFGL